ncbi:MAG TPA: type II toxin-antitoxin system VapC family toxin [Steroidobacteraceae bacterium]|jgi:predicted nucleic-acid-binding protein
MIGLDTNVLVRFLVKDDQAQFDRAQKLIKREASGNGGVSISLLVLLETEWVLRSRYSLNKNEIAGALSGLLDSSEVRIENEAVVERALFVWKDSVAEFADCLIGERYRELGCSATATFDVRALRLAGFVVA